ncbi:MAG: hypothetical protein CVV63_02405, partial [Tenericutes bacterium HGW-Tenericutes-8]
TGEEFGVAAYSIAKSNPVTWTAETFATTSDILLTPASLVTLAAGNGVTFPDDDFFYGKVTVRVWIEGWDADLYDAVFATSLSVALGFSIVE